jgi:TRAP-type C4-dicarboxylate transport system substrate-binding protein
MGAVVAATLLVGGLFCVPATAGDTITLTYANFPPAPTFPCVQMEHWVDQVEQRTDGKVAIDTFPGSTLLGAKNMFDGVMSGQADIGCFAMSYHPGRFPIVEAIDLPMGWSNGTVSSLALWDLYHKYTPESFANVKVLTLFTCPPANIMSIEPVRTLDDLKGMEIRAAGTGVKVLELLGASPVGMPQSDVPDALHKGVIEGMSSSLEIMKDFNYAEYCRYITMTNLQVVTFGVVMNKDRWNDLPADVQAVMEEMGKEQAEWTGRYVDAHVDEAVKWSKETYDVEVIELSAADQEKMHELLEPLVNDYIERTKDKVPAEGVIADVRRLRDMYAEQYK